MILLPLRIAAALWRRLTAPVPSHEERGAENMLALRQVSTCEGAWCEEDQ